MAMPLVTHAVADPSPEQALRTWLDEGLRAEGWCRMTAETGDIDPGWADAAADNPGLTSWVRVSRDWAQRSERVVYDDVDDRLSVYTRGRHVRIFPAERASRAQRGGRGLITSWLAEHYVVIGGISDAA